MSKGSPIITLRLPGDTLDQLDDLIADNNIGRAGEPWTRSSWVRDAIIDKVFHQHRARFGRGVTKAQVRDDLQGTINA